MKLFAILVAICALPQTALAQAGECKSRSEAAARLACYDKAAAASSATATAKLLAPASKADAAKYEDKISSDEDVRMNARLKNICHGC
jgi:hypothetical protein